MDARGIACMHRDRDRARSRSVGPELSAHPRRSGRQHRHLVALVRAGRPDGSAPSGSRPRRRSGTRRAFHER